MTKQPYIIPEDAPTGILVDIHNELLLNHDTIRVHSRWGDFTEYSIKIKPKNLLKIIGVDSPVPIDVVDVRIVMGVDSSYESDNSTFDIQYWHSGGWESLLSILEGEIEKNNFDKIQKWVSENHPEMDALIKIDTILFQRAGAIKQ